MFLLGIGVDDMFLLLSGLAETYDCKGPLEPEDRIKMTMRTSGVGITITSLTDLLAFLIGATSSFMSVRNFCVYTGLYLRLFFQRNRLSFHLLQRQSLVSYNIGLNGFEKFSNFQYLILNAHTFIEYWALV